MRVITGPERRRRRIALYGEPKSRKTNLATAIPWGEEWGERAVYVADDPGAEGLESVIAASRDRLLVVVPDSTDPYQEAVEIAARDWKREYPDVGTLIWDTMTTRARRLLHAFADSGVFSDKHISVGSKGSGSWVAYPQMGDYAMAQRAVFHLWDFLDRQPLNLIVVFHQALADEVANPIYGPKTVGKASVADVGGLFDNLFRLEAVGPPMIAPAGQTPRTEYYVRLQRKGRYVTGMRSTKAVEDFKLGDDPTEFWKYFESLGK